MPEGPAAPEAARFVVVARPGPGLATIADRRDGAAHLWSRSHGRGQGNRRGRRCAACGGSLGDGVYRPLPLLLTGADRLCVACVEGDDR